MGYTHYWRISRPLTESEWSSFRVALAAATVVAKAQHGIALGYYEADDDALAFNGKDGDAYEDFVLNNEPTTFEFCKTDRRNYDALVVAALALAESIAPDAITVSTDGDPEDWELGLDIAQTVRPETEFPAALREVAA